MSAGLPAIDEQEATGAVAAAYADLRAVLGVPVVNLFWRHLATLPGALAWSWAVLRPLYASGAVEAATERLLAGLGLPAVPPLSPATLAAAGVPAAALPQIHRVLATYHRANPLNLMALAALRATLDGRVAASEATVAASAPPARDPGAQQALPALLALEAMPPDAATLVRELATLGLPGALEAGETPSVWRHLAHWPGFLALSAALLRPLDAAGWLAREMDGLRERRDAEAPALLARGAGTPAALLPAESRAPLEAAVQRFGDGLIVRMVPQVALLLATLPRD